MVLDLIRWYMSLSILCGSLAGQSGLALRAKGYQLYCYFLVRIIQRIYKFKKSVFYCKWEVEGDVLFKGQLQSLINSFDNFKIMQNNSQRSSRPLVFNSKADVHQFVMGNASQAYSVNAPFIPQKSVPSFYPPPTSSLFDRYNRPNLLLRECDSKDICILHKNLVMSQQPLSENVAEEIAKKAARNSGRGLMATGEIFQKANVPDPFLQTAPAPTRQFQQNQILFNYKQMGEIKRAKKLQFLTEIQNRIAEAEQQIASLQDLQAQQRMQINDLTRYQQKVGEQLTKNVEVGKIKQKVGYVTGFEEEQNVQPISIHKEMQSRQINEILEEHIRVNEDLLEMAGNVRVKSSEKSKQKLLKTGPNFNSFGNTITKGKQHSKTLVSTMKNGFKPPKNKPKK